MKKGYNLLIVKALEFFLDNPYESIHLRGFSRRIGISPNTAQRFLDYFLSEKIISEERKANLRYFKSNMDSILLRYMKKTFSLKKISDSGIIDYLREKGVSHLVLFGSVAKGEDSLKSDVDLVAIGQKKIDVSMFYSRVKKEINIHFFSFAEWKKQKKENKAFYQDVISSGINLIGEMPLVE